MQTFILRETFHSCFHFFLSFFYSIIFVLKWNVLLAQDPSSILYRKSIIVFAHQTLTYWVTSEKRKLWKYFVFFELFPKCQWSGLDLLSNKKKMYSIDILLWSRKWSNWLSQIERLIVLKRFWRKKMKLIISTKAKLTFFLIDIHSKQFNQFFIENAINFFLFFSFFLKKYS